MDFQFLFVKTAVLKNEGARKVYVFQLFEKASLSCSYFIQIGECSTTSDHDSRKNNLHNLNRVK